MIISPYENGNVTNNVKNENESDIIGGVAQWKINGI